MWKVIRIDRHNPDLEYEDPFNEAELRSTMSLFLDDGEVEEAMEGFLRLEVGEVGLYDNGMDGFRVKRIR